MITFKQFLGDSFLMESREDVIAQQMGPRLQLAFQHDNGRKPEGEVSPLQIVKHLALANPKYVQWTARQYVDGALKWEDIPQVKADFIKFQQLSKADALEQRDIGAYKTLSDLRQVVNGQHVAGVEYKGKLEKLYQGIDATIKAGHGKWVYNNPEDPIKIFVPTDEAGSVAIRRAYPGIGWCTTHIDDMDALKQKVADHLIEQRWQNTRDDDRMSRRSRYSNDPQDDDGSYEELVEKIWEEIEAGEHDTEIEEEKENLHNYYIKEHGGEYYVILTPDQPYQFHFESNQFKDQDDKDVDFNEMLKTYPSIKKVLGPIITKIGHPHFQGDKMDKNQIIKALEAAWTNINHIPTRNLTKTDWIDIITKVLEHYKDNSRPRMLMNIIRDSAKTMENRQFSLADMVNVYDHVITNFSGTLRADAFPGKILAKINPTIGKSKLHRYEVEISLGNIVW